MRRNHRLPLHLELNHSSFPSPRAERFLVVMTQIQKIGQICGHSVYALDQVTCLDFHPELAREKMSKVN